MGETSRSSLTPVFRSLADRHRRYILSYLLDIERRTVTAEELVDHVVERETRSPSDREAVAVAMYRTHLPTLADSGLVDYDRERGVVTATDRIEMSEPFLELARSATGQTPAESAVRDD